MTSNFDLSLDDDDEWLNAECEDMCWTFRTVEQEFKRNRWMEPRVEPCNKPVPQEAKDLAVRMRAILA